MKYQLQFSVDVNIVRNSFLFGAAFGRLTSPLLAETVPGRKVKEVTANAHKIDHESSANRESESPRIENLPFLSQKNGKSTVLRSPRQCLCVRLLKRVQRTRGQQEPLPHPLTSRFL